HKHFVLGAVHPRTGAHSLPPEPARRPHVTAIASVSSDRVVLVGATWGRVASVAEGAISPALLELLAQGRTHPTPHGFSLFHVHPLAAHVPAPVEQVHITGALRPEHLAERNVVVLARAGAVVVGRVPVLVGHAVAAHHCGPESHALVVLGAAV